MIQIFLKELYKVDFFVDHEYILDLIIEKMTF